MNKQINILFLFFLILSQYVNAQEQSEIKIIFPESNNWNQLNEGETLEFNLSAEGGLSAAYRFSALADSTLGFELNEDGSFQWQPGYHIVEAEEGEKIVPIIFEVSNEGGQQASRQVEFVISHKSRLSDYLKPEPFLVQPLKSNIYPLNIDTDEFEISAYDLPKGITIDEGRKFLWEPTETQWLQLGEKPLLLTYNVTDRIYGDRESVSLVVMQAPKPNNVRAERVESSSLKLLLPNSRGWNVAKEGEVTSFKLRANGGADQQYSFNLLQGSSEDLGISFDTLGNFYWQPSFDQVDRLEEEQLVELIFEVSNASGETKRRQVEFLVYHTNRSPEVGELKTFYIQHNTENVYQLGNDEAISDPDDDPLVFKAMLSQMPQGMTLSGNGELSWKPSYSQYGRLQREPFNLEFIVEDQPYKGQSKGKVKIAVTQQDHPPQISMVPANQEQFEIKEDEAINLKFYLHDPNGDEDILAFDFVTETNRIPESALVKNDISQWEFIWTPGYDFFVEPGTKESFELTFFVIDRTNQRSERTIKVVVEDAENLIEKDRLLYSQYREGLLRIMNLMDQLKQRQKELQKEYKKAKKSKKHRAITTASLGAITGLSPVVLSDNQQTQRYVSGIGGTTSMTIGSLEASNVIGRDPSNIFEKLSYINQKLNDLETQGEVFAGKFALANERREPSFNEDLKKLIVLLSLKDVTTLDLDASWKNPRNASDKNIQQTFKSFNPDLDKSSMIDE